MKITLRKANAVQLSINEMIKGLVFETNVSLNEFEDTDDQISEVRASFDANLSSYEKLITALYEIRKMVSRVNASEGINDMLSDLASLEKQIQFGSGIMGRAKVRLSDSVIQGKIEKIKNAKEENRYGRYDTIETGIFSKDEIEYYKRMVADLKRQKQKLQDRLLELNVQTQIELDEGTIRTLEEVNLL